MGRGYGQYCPLALAVELLCERWTLLIISRIMDGCAHFNEIHRGVPRISPSLLSRRLSQLEHAGIVTRERSQKGRPRRYALTSAGNELEPIVASLAIWGQSWARDMSIDDLDPGFLAWSMHMRLDTANMPSGRTVLEFEFTGASPECRRFWLVNDHGAVDMCLKDPGYDIDVKVRADLRLFTEAWRGIRDLRAEIRARRIELIGPTTLTRQFPDWLRLSMLAPYARRRVGREECLSRSRRTKFNKPSIGSAPTAGAPRSTNQH
ncbi:MAG TPA: helix-turn-helix domain-containing protein [Steroidobacteraceae bacterium]|jgi:DNA-binding HxlR family transcriptional regulator